MKDFDSFDNVWYLLISFSQAYSNCWNCNSKVAIVQLGVYSPAIRQKQTKQCTKDRPFTVGPL